MRCRSPINAKHSGRARREQPSSAALLASLAQAAKFASTSLVAVIWATATRVFAPASCAAEARAAQLNMHPREETKRTLSGTAGAR